MEFDTTIDRLIARMNHPLPGGKAHRRALPEDRVEERLNVEQARNPRLGAVLILFFPGSGSEAYFPLIQRPDYPGTHGGQVSLPGGKAESHDRTIIDTALRETEEEIGVPHYNVHVIGRMSDIYIPPSDFRVTPVLGYTPVRPDFKKDPFEVDELLEVPLSHLMDKQYYKYKDIRVRERLLPATPYYELVDKVVWGATAMILSELVHMLEEDYSD